MFLLAVLLFFIALLTFLTFCCLAAGAYIFVAWLALRLREPERRFKVRAALSRSPTFNSYMLACVTSFLIFGPAHLQQPFTNGAEPLPNGYILTAPFDRENGLLSAPTRQVGFSRIERAGAPELL
jgi:hypothetical protein